MRTLIAITALITVQVVAMAVESPVISLETVVPELSNGERKVSYRNSGTEWDRRAHFHVILTNRSHQPQRIWTEGCSWGYYALSFELTDSAGKTWTVTKPLGKPWTINRPTFVIVEPLK